MYRNNSQPQNAIQQSSDFIDLGKRDSALEVLYEAIRARRGKSWTSSIEDAMITFLSLSLNLLNVHAFKDGINQYRILCQTTNVSSFEKVLSDFFDKCLAASEKAQGQSREKLAEDLDYLETPETIILKSVSETTNQDRADRALLSPTLRFCWEAFKNTLDLCKNNRNLEKAYLDTAKLAYKFLLKFDRKTEFRKICEASRSHLTTVLRYTTNTLSVDLSDPISLENQLEMRLSQLETAISMELWNEAYKTMNDIHFLLRRSKKTPHPKILAIFYQKISLVFWRANAPLFHAVALQKLFILIKEHKKGFKVEELMRISTRVLAASLSVPLSTEQTELTSVLSRFSENSSNSLQLASILGLSSIPSRSQVISDMLHISTLQFADPTLVGVYELLEAKNLKSNLCESVKNKLDEIPSNLIDDISSYTNGIKKVAFSIIFKRLSKFYECISLSRIVQYSCDLDSEQCLNFILECQQSGIVDFVYDGHTELVIFSSDVSRFCHSLGVKNPYLLKNLYSETANIFVDTTLNQSAEEWEALTFDYLTNKSNEKDRLFELRDQSQQYREHIAKEQEDAERKLSARVEEERVRLDKLQQLRIEEDRKRRDEKRINEQIAAENQLKKPLANENNIKTKEDGSKRSNVQMDAQEREINGHVKKLKKFEKTVDAFILAKNKHEAPRIAKFIQNAFQIRKESWELRVEERLQILAQVAKSKSEIRERLRSSEDDINSFILLAQEKAQDSHQQLLAEYNHLLETERAIVLKKKQSEYIQKKKEGHVARLKEEFLKKHAPPSTSKSSPASTKFVIGRGRTTKTNAFNTNAESGSTKNTFAIKSRKPNYGF